MSQELLALSAITLVASTVNGGRFSKYQPPFGVSSR
jgi:hypothetical protein